MSEPNDPENVYAVSPEDQSSDREQSDNDHLVTVETSDRNREIIIAKLDTLTTRAEQATAATRELTVAAVKQSDAAKYKEEREATARARYRTTLIVLAVCSLICFLGILSLLLYAQTSRSQLADCIKPTGTCYKKSQARTADVVGNLNRVTVLAAACAPDYVDLPLPARQTAIQQCIVRGLK